MGKDDGVGVVGWAVEGGRGDAPDGEEGSQGGRNEEVIEESAMGGRGDRGACEEKQVRGGDATTI